MSRSRDPTLNLRGRPGWLRRDRSGGLPPPPSFRRDLCSWPPPPCEQRLAASLALGKASAPSPVLLLLEV